MDEEQLKKHLDLLWEKVRQSPASPDAGELASAFELAQSEIHSETLRSLQQRFEKEKQYWENLVASKDEIVARLEKDIQDQSQKTAHLREKIQELQLEQSGIIQQSFSTLEMQKRSLNAHIEKLAADLESARKDALALKLDLEDERESARKLRDEWEEKERHWLEESQKRDMEVEQTKKELYQKRQDELEDVSHLEDTIKKLKRETGDLKTLFETEKAGLQSVLQEKTAHIEKVEKELAQARIVLEKEKEDRKLATVEREKQGVQGEEDRKRMAEQFLTREVRIKELEQTVEKLTRERTEREEHLLLREEKIIADEETVRRRREEWVDSVKNQAGQELNISEKSVDLLSKMEAKLGLKPPVIPHSQPLQIPRPPSLYKDTDETLEKIAEIYPFFKGIIKFLRKRESWVLVLSGLILFTLATTLLFYESKGRKSIRVQSLLTQGNDQFTRGDLEKSLKYLEKAWQLEPQNAIVRNSLTLVLGELAHKDFREGKLDLALKRVEALYQILPDDPDVLKLHGEIMQAFGKASSK